MNKKRKTHALIRLSSKEVRRALKPHKGFERYVKELVELYEERKDVLGHSGIDGPAILAALEAYQDLYVVELAARRHLDEVRQTRLKHSSTAWGGMLDIYARANAVKRSDADVDRRSARFRRFMKHAPRKKPAAPK